MPRRQKQLSFAEFGQLFLERAVTPEVIDSLMLAGCGQPDYAAVRAPALVIYAMIDSVQQVFPGWATFDPAHRAAALRFTAALQSWAAAEQARARRELPAAEVLELHGANHYVFDSHSDEVVESMKAFFARDRTVEEGDGR